MKPANDLPDVDLAALAGDLAAPCLDFDAEQEAPPLPQEGERKTAGAATGVRAQAVRTQARRLTTYDLRDVPNAVKLIRPLPRPGETVHALMDGTFAGWDLIPAILALLDPEPIAELHITTLGFNAANNQNLCDALDRGKIRRVSLVASAYFRGADPDIYRLAEERLTARGQRITATRNHSKIILAAPAGRTLDRFVIESSANLRSCNNLEQFALSNSAELYAFHRAWIEGLFTNPPAA